MCYIFSVKLFNRCFHFIKIFIIYNNRIFVISVDKISFYKKTVLLLQTYLVFLTLIYLFLTSFLTHPYNKNYEKN